MNRLRTEENGGIKMAYSEQEQQAASYGYETAYPGYTTSSTGQAVTQPLPGQPPLPPMPPPGTLPPMPMFPAMPQVPQLQAWGHAGPWQWIPPQTAAAITARPTRDMNNPLKANRGNYGRRDRFNHNRNNVYAQRGHFNRNERRRFKHGQQPGQFDPTTATYWQGIDWQRANFTATQGDGIIHHMHAQMQMQNCPTVGGSGDKPDAAAPEAKKVSEVPEKKVKLRKPMSQSYPIRNWNMQDAMKALNVENQYNGKVRAQSLIIKFPDPDLNKDIVRAFHPGIQNIHFQSPSGPRYCFVQMAEDIDIDKAIEDLEKIPFSVGNLKVERKSLRDEDYPQPEEIDPYTLYVGNLPESVNVSEVKSKFPTASRVDVGYAQKMRNTRYAFVRYINVDDSIAAYKEAHNLMWDTRSIIVRFRRQRGNTCLPGETKNNPKTIKFEVDEGVKKEGTTCNGSEDKSKAEANPGEKTSIHPWTSKSPPQAPEARIITTIKQEPVDFFDQESYNSMSDDSNDDSDDENNEPEVGGVTDEMDENDNEPDDNEDSDNSTHFGVKDKPDGSRDHLDHMFRAIENLAGDIEI